MAQNQVPPKILYDRIVVEPNVLFGYVVRPCTKRSTQCRKYLAEEKKRSIKKIKENMDDEGEKKWFSNNMS